MGTIATCGTRTWQCDIAASDAARVAGLERYPRLPIGSGLVFDWPHTAGERPTRAFRHGDVPYGIRIAWVVGDRIVHAVTSMPPDRGRRFAAAADWVLEVNAAEGDGLVVGARIQRGVARHAQEIPTPKVEDYATLVSNLAAAAVSDRNVKWSPATNGGSQTLVLTTRQLLRWAEATGVTEPNVVVRALLADPAALDNLAEALIGAGFANQVKRRGQWLVAFRLPGIPAAANPPLV